MDLMTLDANNQPAKMVENYDSLIWTERFNTIGDFRIETGDISRFMTLLPEGTVLTLRESNIAMLVETHMIERKKNQPGKLVIVGREYASILDRRVSIQSVSSLTGSKGWIVNLKTPSDVAWYIIQHICVAGNVDAGDIFPASKVVFPAPSDYGTSTGPVKEWEVPRGSLLQTVVDLLAMEAPLDTSTDPDTPKIDPSGIRSVRPAAGSTAIAVQIYKGTDKSNTVYFDASRELLDDGTYLFSKMGSANAAYGVGAGMSAKMFEGASNPTGLDRRVLLVDASQGSTQNATVLKNYMSQALSEAHETAMFDGSINQDLSPYKYGVDYGLGDIVKVAGDYGLDELARVTEYIRSEDATGYKSYPTLTTIVS